MALNNVPVPGQSLGASRDLINQNFSTIDTAFSVNHVPYNDGSGNQGFHKFIQLPSGVPTGVTNNGTAQVALYSNTGPISTVPELFFQRNNLGANAGYSITEKGVGPTPATDGWTRWPAGILVKWGNITLAAGATNGTYSYNAFGPNYSGTPFVVFVSTVYNGGTGAASNFDQTIFFSGFSGTNMGFHKQGTGITISFQYLVIGLG